MSNPPISSNPKSASDLSHNDLTSRRGWIKKLASLLSATAFVNLDSSSYLNASETENQPKAAPKIEAEPKVVESQEDKTDYKAISKAEWKKRLTPQEFKVCREHGTERAYSGKYFNLKSDGTYLCVCCKKNLFDSEQKFDSKTGWPSFWQPGDEQVLGETTDHLLGYPRTEVHCKQCDAHLGHVFDDAPQTPTGLRYCINSV